MAAAQFETWVDVNLQAGVRRVAVPEGFFTQDHQANKLGVRVYNGTTPVILSGGIRWYAKLSNGQTVSDSGHCDGNTAYAILKSEAYACIGPITIALQNIDGNDKTVLAVFTGYVHETKTGEEVIPGLPVPDISNIIETYEEVLEALDTVDAVEADVAKLKGGEIKRIPNGTNWNNAPSGIYLTFANTSNTAYTNTPPTSDTVGYLITYAYDPNGSTPRDYKSQVFVGTRSVHSIYTRFWNGTSWGEWVDISTSLLLAPTLPINADCNSIADGTYMTLRNRDYVHFPDAEDPVGILTSMSIYGYGFKHQFMISTRTGAFYSRYYNSNTSTWTDWVCGNDIPEYANPKRSVSILFVGNSLTQDGIAYLPYMLKTYYPEVDFKLYMWYIGGYTLAQQYAAFNNGTNAAIFSVAENEAAWTNYNSSKTMASVLSEYTFDIVCMQEYFNGRTGYTETDMAAWTNCRNYIQTNYAGDNGLEFVSLFHAPKRDTADSVFDLTVAGNELILSKTIADDMIPNGIAIYRALSTDLDSLGDQTHLSPDGTHAQEGLPCLMQTFTTLCWLSDKIGINKSIYGSPARMTTEIYETLNVPGSNLGTGVITGTDAQNLLAQEVAIQAYKEGKEIVDGIRKIEPYVQESVPDQKSIDDRFSSIDQRLTALEEALK